MGRQKLIHIHSALQNNEPKRDGIELGEIAVNYYPGSEKLYIKNHNVTTGDEKMVSFIPEHTIEEKFAGRIKNAYGKKMQNVFNDLEGNLPKGGYSSAFGEKTITENDHEVAFGKFNKPTSSTNESIATAFTIGGGDDDKNRSNIVEIKKDGTMYLSGVGNYSGDNYKSAMSVQSILSRTSNAPGEKTPDGGEIFNSYGSGMITDTTSGSGDGSVVFHFPKNNTSEPITYSATISTDENVPIKHYDIKVNQEGQSQFSTNKYSIETYSNSTYDLVKSNMGDWSGDYIITGETKDKKTIHIFGEYGKDIGLPVSEGGGFKNFFEFRKGDSFDSSAVEKYNVSITHSLSGPSGAYNIFVKGVGYIGCIQDSNKLSKSDVKDDTKNYQWKISYSNGSVSIKSVGFTNRSLQYNAGNPRFVAYSSTQSPVKIYKRNGESGGSKHFDIAQTSFNVSSETTTQTVVISSDVNWTVSVGGERNIATNKFSHAEGNGTEASGKSAHSEGIGTKAQNEAEHAQGMFNNSVKSLTAKDATQFSIGQGTSNTDRKNLVEVKKDGTMYIKNVGLFNGNNYQDAKPLQDVLNEKLDVLNISGGAKITTDANEGEGTVVVNHDQIALKSTSDSKALSHGSTFNVLTGITGDDYGHVTSKNITAFTLPAGYSHPKPTRTDTVSEDSPKHGETFTAIDSITSNSEGHVTAVNTKTVTLPGIYEHPGKPSSGNDATSTGTAGNQETYITNVNIDDKGHVASVDKGTIPATRPNPYALTIKGNGTVAEIYDGDPAGEVNFTGSGIAKVTAKDGNINVEVPDTNTDEKCTEAGHYNPTGKNPVDTSSQKVQGNEVTVITSLSKDSNGHVTSATGAKFTIPTIPSTRPNPYSHTISQNGKTINSYSGSDAVTTDIKTWVNSSGKSVFDARMFTSVDKEDNPDKGTYFCGINIPYRKAEGNTTADYSVQIGAPTSDAGQKQGVFYRNSGSSTFNSWHRVLDDQNSSVSGDGKTLTVKINDVTKSLTIPTIPDITVTDSGSGDFISSITPNKHNISISRTNTPTHNHDSQYYKKSETYTRSEVVNQINEKLAANDAMLFKGIVGDTPEHVLPANHEEGWTYKVGKAGTYAGKVCEIGDMIICITKRSTANDNDWTVLQNNIDGAVTGPTSAEDGHFALFNGSTGKIIKNSSYTTGNFVKKGGDTITGSLTLNNYLNLTAWPGYGTGTAQIWYNGSTKTVDIDTATDIDLSGNKVCHSGNSSVSKSGDTLTVKINGTSQSLTNTDTSCSEGGHYNPFSTTPTTSAGSGYALNGVTIDSNGHVTGVSTTNTVSNATNATKLSMNAGTANASRNIWFNDSATAETTSGNLNVCSNPNFKYNPHSGLLTVTSVSCNSISESPTGVVNITINGTTKTTYTKSYIDSMTIDCGEYTAQ